MDFGKKNLELTDNILKDIALVAKTVFCDGIYVPCEHHISGYDFISFDMIELEPEEDEDYSVFKYKFESYDISNGVYDSHPYDGMTLKEILEKTENRFRFE